MKLDAEAVAPLLDWTDFRDRFAREWRQGEHVSLVGPTGQGKSTFALEALPIRRYVVIAATKPKDATLDRLTRRRAEPRYKLLRDFTDRPHHTIEPRVLLWPKFARMADIDRQADVIHRMLNDVFADGSWCVYMDELHYACRQLGLADALTLIWQQGRSLGISLVGATQRPAWVPLELYSSASHVCIWRHSDPRDLDRLSGIAAAGDVDPRSVRKLVGMLPRHEFLYVNTRTGEMVRSKVRL